MSERKVGVVELLQSDHQRVEVKLSDLDAMADPSLANYFCELREELVRHEVAEETVVYPAVRQLQGGDKIADSCIEEQSEAEELLADMEKVQDDVSKLRTELGRLRSAVLKHAKHEESEVFPLLKGSLPEEDLVRLGQRYEKALAAAPTHPHPHAPDTPPGNLVAGPLAALVDRARDAMKAAV
ncbi:MAG: hemerythrin domain-containing protein [Acidimicrobiales bacterium]|jgi:hemerythrin superfamily protein